MSLCLICAGNLTYLFCCLLSPPANLHLLVAGLSAHVPLSCLHLFLTALFVAYYRHLFSHCSDAFSVDPPITEVDWYSVRLFP